MNQFFSIYNIEPSVLCAMLCGVLMFIFIIYLCRMIWSSKTEVVPAIDPFHERFNAVLKQVQQSVTLDQLADAEAYGQRILFADYMPHEQPYIKLMHAHIHLREAQINKDVYLAEFIAKEIETLSNNLKSAYDESLRPFS